MELRSLIQAIEAAFPLQPLPEVSLYQACLLDDAQAREISGTEWAKAGRHDAGRSWQDYSDDELIGCEIGLAHLDPASWAYYLPAFLVFTLRHCDVPWSNPAWSLVGSVVFTVTHRSAYSLSRFQSLSPNQREAVVAFLEYVAAHGGDNAADAEKALVRYWRMPGVLGAGR